VYASRASGNWDIYLQRVGGKNQINLTKDSPADDTQPAFSPDGERIAFRSEREGGGIFVMGATGESVKRLTDFGYNPAWSPDGKEIVCAIASYEGPEIRFSLDGRLFAINSGTGAKRLIATQMADAVQPQWSPHGYRVAYWALVQSRRNIWTVSAQGGQPVAVTDDNFVNWSPVWSPDGRYLYFSSDRGGSMNLWRVPIAEQSGQALGAPEAVTTPSLYSGHFSFSRDGLRIAYTQQTRTSNVYRVGFDPVKEMIMGAPVPITQGTRQIACCSISPDGEWLAALNEGQPGERSAAASGRERYTPAH
jgi:Tol biopolymer transport system component